jgi:nicotinamide-nucleotide amidase
VRIELINTGTELLLGRVLNTNQQWLCRQLADLGLTVERQVAVPDTAADIQNTLRESLGRADLILTTGGLGPTSDDRSREVVAELLGLKLRMDESVRKSIEDFFTTRGRPQPRKTEVQALVPEGALVLPNTVGTAPGLAIEVAAGEFGSHGSWIIMLPGPSAELRAMFTEKALPLIQKLSRHECHFASRTLRSTGMGESMVEEKIAFPLASLVAEGLEIGYCARAGEVDVRLGTRGNNGVLDRAEEIVRGLIGEHIFGTEDESIEEVVVRALTERKETLAVAESCTGGALAHRLTNVPGASAVFLGGLVAYNNEVKQRLLGVRADTIERHGAVSEPVAREMAEGARKVLGADNALATTGIAGPGGGTSTKPVGTVFIALATAQATTVLNPVNAFGRETFKNVTTQQALDLLRRGLKQPTTR